LFYIFSHHWRHSTPALFVSRLVTNPRFKAWISDHIPRLFQSFGWSAFQKNTLIFLTGKSMFSGVFIWKNKNRRSRFNTWLQILSYPWKHTRENQKYVFKLVGAMRWS
jgi:hypothetical protein